MYNQLVKGILILVKGIDAFIESIQSMCGSNDIIQSMESIEPYQVYRNFPGIGNRFRSFRTSGSPAWFSYMVKIWRNECQVLRDPLPW